MKMSAEAFNAIVSANLEQFAAFSWMGNEHIGRGVVVVDTRSREVTYCPVDKLHETAWDDGDIPEDLAKKCAAYNPEADFVVVVVGPEGWRAARVILQIPPPVLARMRELEKTTSVYRPMEWSLN